MKRYIYTIYHYSGDPNSSVAADAVTVRFPLYPESVPNEAVMTGGALLSTSLVDGNPDYESFKSVMRSVLPAGNLVRFVPFVSIVDVDEYRVNIIIDAPQTQGAEQNTAPLEMVFSASGTPLRYSELVHYELNPPLDVGVAEQPVVDDRSSIVAAAVIGFIGGRVSLTTGRG